MTTTRLRSLVQTCAKSKEASSTKRTMRILYPSNVKRRMRLIPLAFALLSVQVRGATAPAAFFESSDDSGAYTAWLETASYSKSAFLSSTGSNSGDDENGVALYWTIGDDTIQLAVVAKTTGWVAFGLGESGSMLGADIVLFSTKNNTLVDSYVLDQAVFPLVDDCQSWTLVNSTVDNDILIFEATRLLDTGDSQDRVFLDDSNVMMPPPRVLAAWGDSAEPSFHGTNTAKGAIRFFGKEDTSDELDLFARAMAEEAEGSFLIQAKDFLIPTDTTTYQDFCFSRDDLLALNVSLDKDLHLIGFEPVIDPRTVEFVHHYGLTASLEPYNPLDTCTAFPETAFGWAPGTLPFLLPDVVGGPLGLNGYQSFSLEIHYNNPKAVTNQYDSSGVRMYYTSKKRQYDMGGFSLGDSEIALLGELVSTQRGLAQHVFECDGSCSSSFLTEPVTVILESLHMHRTGVSMINAQIRNGEVIRQGMIEYWDFQQQGDYAVVQPPFTIEPGDSFRTICNYMAKNGNETWGLASDEEMCLATLYYYPRRIHPEYDIEFACGLDYDNAFAPECSATHSVTAGFSQSSQLERVFGAASTECGSSSGDDSNDGTPAGSSSSSSSVTVLGSFLFLVALPIAFL